MNLARVTIAKEDVKCRCGCGCGDENEQELKN